MEKMKEHTLKIDDFCLWTKIGVTADEKKVRQEVRISFELFFFQPPAAMQTDKLEDTVCYAQILEKLRDHVTKKNFNLIENLASECLQIVKAFCDGVALVHLSVKKVSPPIEGLIGGVSYRCREYTQ